LAGNALNVQTPAVLSADTHIPDVIKVQCKVPEWVGNRVLGAVSKVYGDTQGQSG